MQLFFIQRPEQKDKLSVPINPICCSEIGMDDSIGLPFQREEWVSFSGKNGMGGPLSLNITIKPGQTV